MPKSIHQVQLAEILAFKPGHLVINNASQRVHILIGYSIQPFLIADKLQARQRVILAFFLTALVPVSCLWFPFRVLASKVVACWAKSVLSPVCLRLCLLLAAWKAAEICLNLLVQPSAVLEDGLV